MADFSLLFQKFLKAVPIETVVRDFLMEYLKNNHSIDLHRNVIQIQKNNIILNISPIIKTKLNPHKSAIMEDLNTYLKEKGINKTFKSIM